MSMNILTSLRRHWALSMTLAAALALLVLLAVGMTRDPRELPSMLIGKPWPDVALTQLGSAAADGNPVGPAQLRGKPRMINVWASWCAVCITEQPAMLALAKKLGEEGHADQLIGLNWKDRPQDASKWLQRWGDPFAFSLVDQDNKMGIELGVYGAPETFLIDAQGIIVWKHVGELTDDMIANEVLPRLKADRS
jgi:cytochrome c biogenesis protein CcmG/thiol:disulfide interchange protein DsbE